MAATPPTAASKPAPSSVLPGVVLGLGGNIDDDATILHRFSAARLAVSGWGEVRLSRVYRSAGVGVGSPMPDFLNAAIHIRVAPQLTPARLITMVLQLEQRLGRTRAVNVRYAPRTIDIDVLLWGDRVVEEVGPPALHVPHPHLHQRRFALRPCIDLLGRDALVPGTAATLGAFDDALGNDQSVVELVAGF